jgi:hypothetical protein
VDNAQQWRLAYCGVTITQDGPALADQGTCVCSQGPVIPIRATSGVLNYATTSMASLATVEVYSAEDLPNYTASQALPNAYFDLSKKGTYVPLKLTRTSQSWRSQSDLVGTGIASNLTADYGYVFPTAMTYAWPHWSMLCTYASGTATPGYFNPHRYLTSPMLNDVMAHISVRNVAVTTSFAFFFRVGLELRVHPSSALSPQLTLAPRHDPRALESYFAISRELKDAYEAKYNDAGKLWNVISSTVKSLAPVFSRFGTLGQSVAQVGSSIAQFGDQIQVIRQRRRKAKIKPRSTATPTTQTLAVVKRAQPASSRQPRSKKS